GKRRIKGKVEIIIDKGTDSSEDRIHLNMREERMEQWQTALNRVIVCLVILFIDHEHILPKEAPHPLRIRCLFLFLDCQKFNSPFFRIISKGFCLSNFQNSNGKSFGFFDMAAVPGNR
ncbi:hypothetical protein BO224_02825, partial [Erysipelotrichaceae bacterium NYU-BL-E8]